MRLRTLFVLMAFWALGSLGTVSAASTSVARCEYVIRNLHLDKAKAAKFRPVMMAYLKELKTAKSGYDNLKDKLKGAIKGHRISEGQATQLLNAHWNSDAAEVNVRRKYTTIFRQHLTARQTYEAFSYANDNKDKILGRKTPASSSEDE